MGNNSLHNTEKNLRSIAKRYENVKYSVGLAVLFLMKGTSAFSDENKIQEVEKQKEAITNDQIAKSTVKEVKKQETKKVKTATQKPKASWTTMQFGANDMYSNFFVTPKNKVEKASIVKSEKTILVASADNSTSLPMLAKLSADIETTDTNTNTPTMEEIKAGKANLRDSVGNLKDKIDVARRENNKEINGLRLELIQLMEQGNQVVKSPWSSWQFGANYFYENWGSAYKGRGDKAEKYPFEGIYTRNSNLFTRNISPNSELYKDYVKTIKDDATNSALSSTLNARGRSTRYGLASNSGIQEPVVSIEINAAIKPKSIEKAPITLNFTAPNAPTIPTPSIAQVVPPNLTLPEPKAPSKEISIVKPNANPFTGFFFNSNISSITSGVGNTDMVLYSGVNPDDIKAGKVGEQVRPALKTGALNTTLGDITDINQRPTNILYRMAPSLNNLTFHIRGYFGDGSDGYVDAGSGATGGSDTVGGPTLGTIGVHTLLNGTVSNVTANLYGRAGFLTSETWRHGKVTMHNTNVNVYGKDNAVYYIMPAAFKTISKYTDSNYHLGAIQGETNVKMYGTGNTVYLSSGISAARLIKNTGKIELEGASNIVYSSFSYAPTWEVGVYGGKAGKMNSLIQFNQNVELYGDENVGLFFGSKIGGNPKSWEIADRDAESNAGYIRKASYIGIYQGEIDVKARVGGQLAIDPAATTQTASGQLVEDLTNPANPKYKGYTDKTVDGGVGIYVTSGQRKGIDVLKDMGVPVSVTPTLDDLKLDPIHNLEVGKMDISFGKYSKNGFMMIAKDGSVIDVGKATHQYYVTNLSTSITDGVNGATTTEADASTGTTIAYAEGTWDQNKHQLGSKQADLNQNNTDAAAVNAGAARKALTDSTASTAAKLQGLGSEINVYTDVILASKEGIAYMGDNQGIVNAKKTTQAVNYGSIIAYAKNKGQVTVDGAVTAVDQNTTLEDNKYKNIAAFAESGGQADIKGKVTINGIGAFAKGTDSKAQLLSGTDVINAGVVGGIVATDNGYARLDGGTINITKDNSRLFYADATGKIDFTKATTINMSKGIILPQEENNTAFYSSKATTEVGAVPTKYNGMRNVTIKLLSDDVVLKTVNNHPLETWTGSTNFESGIQSVMKYAALNKNGHTYKVYYTNGQFKIATNVDLDDTNDVFNSIIMANEKVTIDNGISITSNVGKGLVQGSLANTVDNSKTAYINNGTVNVSGANSSSIALRVNHGTIENNSLVKITDGIGLYGSSGSKIENKTNGTIQITSASAYGVGIAGFLSGTTAQNYGTDKLISDLIAGGTGNKLASTTKTIDITNEGNISVTGKAVGIYADNTSTIAGFDNHVTKENAVVNNKASLSFGDESIGILTKKATINLTGTGTDDISVGKEGIGVVAEDSTVNLLTDYGFQIKDKGVGIYAENSETSTGTMNVRYTGATTEAGTGAYFKGTGSNSLTNKLDINVDNVSNTTKGMIGIYAKDANFTNEGKIKVTNTNTLGFGIIASGADVTNKGEITLEDSLNPTEPNIGLYTVDSNPFKNMGKITVGKNGIGIYGKNFSNGDSVTLPNSTIEVGENGIGVYTESGNGYLESGSIKTGKDGVGVYVAGNGGTITANNTFNMTLGDGSSGNNKGSFGFVNVGSNNKIYSDISNVTLQNNSVYIYSKDTSGTLANPQITNNTNITATGNNNYGLYSAGYVVNNGNMNLSAGTGNVGVYSIKAGTIENRNGVITVGGSVPGEDEYGIGMAAGYTWTKKDLLKPISQRPEQTTGNIVNRGTINVNGQYSMGMYGSGNGTTVNNYGTINLNANNTTGVYLTDKAVGTNYGTITNTPGVKNVTAIVVKNGARFVNDTAGVIRLNATNALGVLKTNDVGESIGIFENYGTFEILGSGSEEQKIPSGPHDLSKSVGKGKDKISIDVPAGATTGTIKVAGEVKIPEVVETKGVELEETQVSTIGMYINTSGIKFTKPITGLSALTQIKKADLIIGAEAAQSTTSKYIQVGKNILKPYNDTILNNPQIEKWGIYSGSLTWMANIAQNQSTGTIENAYLVKIPYTNWAGNEASPVDKKDTYNFLDGLEQRYGVEALGTRENQLFQKLNSIGNNEEILFHQATDEMMGHQYANVQQRVVATGDILDKEFKYLRNEWSNPSKDSNKIKTFGANGEYKTSTAGVIDYKNNAYGVAYVHEDETVRLGESTGWYAGIVHNTFRFKDIGNSKEEMLQGKLGLFKSVPFDENNSLNWTISGDIFAGYNKMHRKFLVVDEVFNAKGRYHTYGLGIKNEISKEFRLSESFTFKTYAALGLEYGRVSKIKEKSGEIKLDVKSNDYFSVRPEIGAELGFKHYFDRKTVRVGVSVAYENELGRVANGKNQAKVAGTNADYFNIRGEKDDRTGNVKTDFNIGVDNQRVGVTANVGYDTKGNNVRAGVGLRVIF
ncbi:autotransporter-associated N-terminal domain-containing protein [Fusobacterium pseudoperiodonticum]|uniref:autotransporter-associated N-terminal domain-containing protein n=1 Tax=Fusobacterium pseudoperiodonticum TaxID=2663009 RepID=UPI000C1B9FC6|nr:autotransporter-associated N-terminal domain-containing protein [Fusobacterium pseudoperiodonticum]ATV64477.1 autotransporter domain-containing protein [Fusobacterium pseudoperiodonticum]